jgi:hypothetical protein
VPRALSIRAPASRTRHDEEIAVSFCGIDWADAHHAVAVVDTDGNVVAAERISNDRAGYARLVELLADAGERRVRPCGD